MEAIKKGQEVLIINSWRCANHAPQAGPTMTVGELIGLLEWYDPTMPVIIRGYDEYQFNPVDDESIQPEVIE